MGDGATEKTSIEHTFCGMLTVGTSKNRAIEVFHLTCLPPTSDQKQYRACSVEQSPFSKIKDRQQASIQLSCLRDKK